MNTKFVAQATTACLLLAGAGMLHANLYPVTPGGVQHKLEVMEKAVSASSVTGRYAPEQRQTTLAIIEDARANLREGNYKTAATQLEEAARALYPMKEFNSIGLSEDKRQQWVAQMDRAIEALMPAAKEIAQEKQAQTDILQVSEALYVQGHDAYQFGDYERAERLLTKSYLELQRAVVSLRSGDQLVIEQPPSGTESAWKEAERRYEDWRFFADWMERSSEELGIDPGIIAQGSIAADQLFQRARGEAEVGNWGTAMAQIDQAYLTMETFWREAGIDI